MVSQQVEVNDFTVAGKFLFMENDTQTLGEAQIYNSTLHSMKEFHPTGKSCSNPAADFAFLRPRTMGIGVGEPRASDSYP
jgi:hypothetical protein